MGEIELQNGKNTVVFLWDGTLYNGKFTFKGDKKEIEKITGMMLAREDLKNVYFYSTGMKFKINGFDGFEGNLGVIRIISPVIGYEIKRIKYPNDE